MPRPKLLFLLIAFLFCSSLIAQIAGRGDFYKVDSFSRSIKKHKDIYKLTYALTTPYDDQLSKVRSIFIWITDSIRYDYKFYNKGIETKSPKCKPGQSCQEVFRKWEDAYLKKILKRRKAICGGYAMLFKKMCDISGIKSEIIEGYAKTEHYQVGITGPVDHAWNAVWLDSAYFMLDATWAAGGCEEDEETGKLLNFKKGYNDYYWFTSFPDFTRNHYPKDNKWVVDPAYTKQRFADEPYYSVDIISDIKLVTPLSGVITAKKGDTIHFKFDYKDEVELLQVNTNIFRNPTVWKVEKTSKGKKYSKNDPIALKKQKYIKFKRSDDRHEFDYIVTDNLYYLEILLDYRRVMKFKIKIIDSKTL